MLDLLLPIELVKDPTACRAWLNELGLFRGQMIAALNAPENAFVQRYPAETAAGWAAIAERLGFGVDVVPAPNDETERCLRLRAARVAS